MSKPDDRRDNAQKIKSAVNATKQNIEAAEEMIANTDSKKTKQDLEAKNERRRQAIPGMEKEMREEERHSR